MGLEKVALAPNGDRWVVRRRWLDRPLPNLRKRFKRDGPAGEDVIEGLFASPDVGDSWASIGLAVAVLLVVFVLLPLLGVALEVIVLIFFLWSGIVTRVVLGRPWTVEARRRGEDERVVEFQVKGWRRAGRTVTDLADQIRATGAPESFVLPGQP